jgi:hypothetical protein
VLLERHEDGGKGEGAFARTAPIGIVQVHMRDQAGRQPLCDQFRDALGLAATCGGGTVDHRPDRSLIDLPDDCRCLFDRIHEARLVGRQRLDAIGHARRCCGICDTDKAFCAPLAIISLAHLPLIGRAVHHNSRAEVMRQFAEPPHHLDRARPHRIVRTGDREPRRRPQNVMQSCHGDSGIAGGLTYGGTSAGGEEGGIVAKCKRRDFHPVIAELRRYLALPLERQAAQHLVAKGYAHCANRERPVD